MGVNKTGVKRGKKGRALKTVEAYEAEAVRDGECLIHSSRGVARICCVRRHGPLLTQQYVCHTCDRPNCILDAHHFIGTCRDNVRDAVAKGRHSCFRKGVARFQRPRTDDEKTRISAGLKKAYAEGRR